MRIKHLLTILALFQAFIVWGQLKEKSSNDIESSYNDETLGVAELSGGGFVVLREDGGDYKLYLFNDALELQSEAMLSDDFAENGYMIYGCMDFGGKALVVYELFDSGEKKDRLYAAEIDPVSGTVSDDHHLLAEFSVKSLDLGQFAVEFTSSGSSLLVYYVQRIGSSEPQLIRYSLIDSDFNTIASFEKAMGHEGDLFAYTDYVADDMGNVFVSGMMYADYSTRNSVVISDEAEAQYLLLYIEKGAEEYREIDIEIGERIICSQSITVDASGSVIISGLYSSVHTGFSEGTFVLKYDPFMERFSEIAKTPFTAELIKMTDESDTQDKYQRKGDYEVEDEDKEGLYNLLVTKTVYRDGRLYMFVEEPGMYALDYWNDVNIDRFYVGKHATGSTREDLFPGVDKSSSFWEGGLYIFVFDESLQTDWYTYVPRDNKVFDEKDPLFISFFDGVYEGQVFVCYYERREHKIRFMQDNVKDPKQTSNSFSSDYMPRLYHMTEVEKGFVYVSSDKKTFQLNSVKL